MHKVYISIVTVVRQFQEYVEPDDAHADPSTQRRGGGANPLHPSHSGHEEEKVLLPLGETTLTNNTGVPVVVVITKVTIFTIII